MAMPELSEKEAAKIADAQDNTYGEPKKITSTLNEVVDQMFPAYETKWPEQPWSKELLTLQDKYIKSQARVKKLEEQLEMKTKQVKFLQEKLREK